MTNKTSIKRRFLIFAIILFLVILIGGSITFALSMWQIFRINAGKELARAIEIERIKLEASVNGEITVALKMAGSPIIQQYFAHPEDPELERIAFEEIAGYRSAFASNSVFWVNDIDKKFYSDDAYAFTIDTTDPNNYWYLMTLNETEKYNFNINYNPDLNVINLWINAPVFDHWNRPIGILGTGIDLTVFINAMYKDYSGDAQLYFFNMDGEITGAKDFDLVANKAFLVDVLGYAGMDVLNKARDMKSVDIQYFNTPSGVIALNEVPTLDWFITAVLPLTLLNVLKSSMTVFFFAIMMIIALIFVVFYIFMARMIEPMNHMVQTLDQISTDWDLTQRLQLTQRDEIGTLGDFFNLTFEKMRKLLVGIKNKCFTLADTGEELTTHMSLTEKDIDRINANIQMMREQVLTQSDKVNSAAGSIERIITGLNNLNENITVQAGSVAQSSSAIEQMLANIQSVTQTLVKNSANINSLAESSETGRADLQKVSADIQEIARESEGLLEINSVMQNIASQTNLLSMNAAIEAAHAGESGRGFAVVADEIRKLAENSGVQSKTISAVLKKIKASIDTITKSTGIVLERFETIEREVQTVSNQETQIRSAMEEQGIGSRNILEAITQLNSVTDLVRRTSSDMTIESKEVVNQSNDLKRITTDVAGSMDEMTVSADEISNAITRVKEISEENKENIGTLNEDVSRFKVE